MKRPTMTGEQFQKMIGKKNRGQKYKRSAPEDRTWNGVVYDSKAEMVYHQMHPWCEHHPTPLVLGQTIKYCPDFWDDEREEYIEVKGAKTSSYNLKIRWIAESRTGYCCPIREVKAKYRKGKIVEFVTLRMIVPGQPVPRVVKKKRKD